jgi:predicted GH43/DUF377 family glycosyl hydrolase
MATTSGWACVLRTQNGYLNSKGVFIAPGFIKNECWEVLLDDQFKMLKHTRLHRSPEDVCSKEHVFANDRDLALNGIEDGRLFQLGGSTYILGVANNFWKSSFRMVLAELTEGALTNAVFFESPFNQLQEKNWMPVDIDGELHVVYKANPFLLLRLHTNGTHDMVATQPLDPHADNYSGSSQVIPYKDGWLCIVHRAVRLTFLKKRVGRLYLHRFLYFDKAWKIAAKSKEFFLEHKGVEFCAGLANKNNRFVISYGINDDQARLVELSGSQLESLLF